MISSLRHGKVNFLKATIAEFTNGDQAHWRANMCVIFERHEPSPSPLPPQSEPSLNVYISSTLFQLKTPPS